MPVLSIITITFNAEKYLEQTILSIKKQDSQDFEYILIDGKSKDKTLKIVEKYKEIFSKIISEPDKGLYDAMNKGLQIATGDFVWFVNAGDEIADNQAISKIKKIIDEKTDVLYGETYFINETGEILGLRSQLTTHKISENLNWQDMKYGMLVCHQSFIARKSIAPFYDDISNLSADLDWEIECLKRSRKTIFLDFVVSKYLIGGVSNQQLKRSLIGRFKVLKKHFGLLSSIFIHLVILFRAIFKIIRNGGKYW